MKKGALTLLVAVVALFFSSRPASATVILDSDFFSGTTHMVITFETDGLGNKLNLAEGQTQSMPADEYAFPTVHDGLRGVRFIQAAVESSNAGGRWTAP